MEHVHVSKEQRARELAIQSTKDVDDNGNEVYNAFVEAALLEMADWQKRQTLETVLAAIDEHYNMHKELYDAFVKGRLPLTDELSAEKIKARTCGYLSALLVIKDIITNKLKEEA